MREVILWAIVILCWCISMYFIIRTFVFAHSLSNDAPYVPVGRKAFKEAMKILQLKEADNFVDIGSGDGYAVLSAADLLKGKGTFTGIEISKVLVFWSNVRRMLSRYARKVNFINEDMFEQDYFQYNKVFLFLTEDLLKKLVMKLEYELPKGSRVVSVLFKFPDEFMKANRVEVKRCKMWGKEWNLYLWTKK
jgi:hypothetical protein